MYKFRATGMDCSEGEKNRLNHNEEKAAGMTGRCKVSNRWQVSQKSGAVKVSNADGLRIG